jgi:hypothetical protein
MQCAIVPVRENARHIRRNSQQVSFLDKIKGLIGGNKSKADDAIDKVSDVIQSKTPDSIDDKVEAVADTAKKAVDKLKK